MNYEKDRVYAVKDLVFRIIKNWKTLIVAGVIFAVLLGAAKYIKDIRANQALWESQNSGKTIADQVAELPESERESIENLCALNMSLREATSYKENSYAIQIDPYHVACYVLKYKITAASDDDLTMIKHYYDNEIESEKVIDQFREILNADDEDSSISKCIEVDFNNSNQVLKDNNILTITLKSDDEELSADMAKIAEDTVKEAQKEAQDQIGNHEIKLMSEVYQNEPDTSLLSAQNDLDTKIFNLSNQINTLMNSLDETDKSLVKAYVNETAGETSDEATSADTTSAETALADTTSQIPKVSFSKKWILAGFMCGIVLAAGILGILWLLDPRIQSVGEYRNNISTDIYGVLDARKKRGILSDVFYKIDVKCPNILSAEENIGLISTKISIYAKTKNIKSLMIAGDHFDKDDSNISRIAENLEDNGVNVTIYNRFLQSTQALKAAAETGNVLFVEEIGASCYSDVHEKIDRCKDFNIKIAGCILMYK